MDWIAQNWVWMVFAVAFIAMHLFGHGGHGGSGGCGGGHRHSEPKEADGDRRQRQSTPTHRH
jgi:hypothetical protein